MLPSYVETGDLSPVLYNQHIGNLKKLTDINRRTEDADSLYPNVYHPIYSTDGSRREFGNSTAAATI